MGPRASEWWSARKEMDETLDRPAILNVRAIINAGERLYKNRREREGRRKGGGGLRMYKRGRE